MRVLLGAVLMLACSSMSFASSISINQSVTGIGNFNQEAVFLSNSGTFTVAGLSNFSLGSWVGSDVNVTSTYTKAGGNLVSALTDQVNLSYTSTPVTFDEFFLNSGTVVWGAKFTFDGSNITDVAPTVYNADQRTSQYNRDVASASTPEPPTLSFMFGVVAISIFRQRRHGQNT